MSLPLPRVIPDIGAGGGIATAMRGMNALSNDMLSRQINSIKARYAPLTTQAEAASKLAYANLMGPQFLAKLMGNESALANMSEDQKRDALSLLYRAGSGQGTGNALLGNGNPLSAPPAEENPSLSGWLTNKIKNVFSGNSQPEGEVSASRNALASVNPSSSVDMNALMGTPSESELGKATNAWMNQPAVAAKSQKEGMTTFPADKQLLDWYRAQQNPQNSKNAYAYDENGHNIVASPEEVNAIANGRAPTYAENTGKFKGTVEEGKELGKIRAKAVDDLDQQYQQAVQSEVPLKHINDIVNNPVFQNMRNFPWFQNLQLNVKSKVGTPEEQKLIGDLQSTAQNVVSQGLMGMKGRVLDKEIDMFNKMKVSPEDTINVMLGKLPSLETFNEMTKQRSRIASQLIEKQHLNRGEALEQADKMVNGEAIRKGVEDQLKVAKPQVTDADIQFMADKYKISPDEVKKRLKAKGVY